MYTATRSSRYDPDRNVLRNIRITAEAAARTRRNRRLIWLAVSIISVALLIALALTDTAGAACTTYTAAARVTNISRVWYRPGSFDIAGYTYGRPQYFFAARTRLALRTGQTVIASGCLSTERQLTSVTVRLP